MQHLGEWKLFENCSVSLFTLIISLKYSVNLASCPPISIMMGQMIARIRVDEIPGQILPITFPRRYTVERGER
jgi:hypothetical protein